MITLTPTKAVGATSKANDILYVEPALTVTDKDLADDLGITGVNAAFVADLLSACLAHERCGTHLYRSVAGRTANPVLKAKYEEFGAQTLRHVEILENVIASSGGNPSYVSPLARATEAADTKALEATFLGDGGLDPMAAEMAMLDAVFVAEAIDHADWEALGLLITAIPDGTVLRDELRKAVAQVQAEEDEHLGWARDTRARLTMLQVSSSVATKAASKAEEVVAQVKGWLSGSDTKGRGGAAPRRTTQRPSAKKKSPTKKASAKKRSPAKKASAKRTSPAKKASAKKRSPAKKASAKKTSPAKRAPAAKATSKRVPTKPKASRRR